MSNLFMFNSWITFYIWFCTVTSIFSLFKLYIPCWEQIKKENDKAARKIKTRPVLTGIIFSIFAFIFAPIFLVIGLFEDKSQELIKAFVKGNLGKP